MITAGMPGWSSRCIGDDCIVGDGAHAKIQRQPSGVLYLTCKNFFDGRINLSKADYISEADYDKYFRDNSMSLTKLRANDVLLSIIGTIGESYLIRRQDRFGLSSSVAIIRPNEAVILPKYLYYWMKGQVFQSAIYGIKGGVAQGYMSLEMIRSLPLHYPPLPTQRKIAAILSAYDDLIENNNRRIKILEEIARMIYQEWFVEFRFPSHENAKMVASQVGMIPQGWEVKMLGDIAEDIRRSVNPSDIESTTPYFGLEHLPRKSIALSQWGIASEVKSTKLAFQKGEILFGKIRPYFHKVGVAPLEGVCSSDTIVIRPKHPAYFGLLLACVSSERFVNHASQTSQGTKMPRANWGVLVKYMIPAPQGELLSQYNRYMNQTVELIHNMILQNRNLRQTRDLLLPRLISGGLDVSGLDIDIGEDAA